MGDIQEQIDALAARVAALERGDSPRLGPRPETPEEEAARTKRIADALAAAVSQDVKRDPPPVDRTKLCTTDGRSPEDARASQTNETGQHASYIVLCDEERAKGFVRPYRDSYRHVGPRICGLHVGPDGATVCYMDPGHAGECGIAAGPRPQFCGKVTTMGRALSETYARDPGFYGATFCCTCNQHLPVSEFVWTADGEVVGS